ncbi:DUF6402 family protein [Pseudomonas sp. RT6P73]
MADTKIASSLTPASNQAGKSAAVRQFKITDIPDAMDKMKWPVAAKLMRHWFNGKPWPTVDGAMSKEVKDHVALPKDPYVEDTIVKMAWLNQFEPAKAVIKELKSVWNNPAAQKNISDKIKTKYLGKAPGVYPFKFDGSARKVEEFGYSNNRAVKFGLIEKTDELRAALANFNVRVFPEGKVIISVDSVQLFADRIGFYVEDAYDFNDAPDDNFSQPLGYWNFDGITNPAYATAANAGMAQMKSDMASNPFLNPQDAQKMFKELDESRYFYISNSHFVKYRTDFGKGGDFQVLSDVQYESVPLTVINVWNK